MTTTILALETATDACSVALLTGEVCAERHEVAPRRHTKLIFNMMDEVLNDVGLTPDAIGLVAFGRGPGSFTGVRIAASVTQGIAFARNLPVAPVSTLLALAAGGARLFDAAKIVAMMDARRGEVYVAAYEVDAALNDIRVIVEESVIPPQRLALPPSQDWFGVGNGWQEHAAGVAPAAMPARRGDLMHPHASDIARLARGMHAAGNIVAAQDALPIYLRGGID